MAIYSFERQPVSRSQRAKGKTLSPDARVSLVNKAAYIRGERIHDERLERDFDYRRKQRGVIATGVSLPEHAPEWMQDAEKLCNAVERVEKRKDSQLAMNYRAALPRELSREQNISEVERWAKIHTERGRAVLWGIHNERASDGAQQPHFHALVMARPVDGSSPSGFAAKKPSTEGKFNGRGIVGLQAKDELQAEREAWAEQMNAALAAAGVEARVDHRSYEARGIDRMAQPKLGPAASRIMRRGQRSERGDRWRVVVSVNAGADGRKISAALAGSRRSEDRDVEEGESPSARGQDAVYEKTFDARKNAPAADAPGRKREEIAREREKERER